MSDEAAKDSCDATTPASPDSRNWKSTKLWYSILLQVGATALLLFKQLSGDQWVWVTSMIYGGYVLGNVGVTWATGSLSRR